MSPFFGTPFMPPTGSYSGVQYPAAPAPAWGGGAPQSFYDMRGLSDTGLIAGNYAWNPRFDAPWGDVRQAARNIGFEGQFGQGRLNEWLSSGRNVRGLQEELPQVRERRLTYAQQAFPEINPFMWEGHVQPFQMHSVYDVPFGVARSAMRNLGFEGPFGGGRGSAFQEQVGEDAVRAEIARISGQQPYEQRAYVPNYSMYFNPFNFLGAGAQPFFGEPWYHSSLLGKEGGVQQYLRPQTETPADQRPDWFTDWLRRDDLRYTGRAPWYRGGDIDYG